MKPWTADRAYEKKKKGFSYVQKESLVFHFVPITSCPAPGHDWKESDSVFLTLIKYFYTLKRFIEHSLLQAKESQLSQPFYISDVPCLNHLCGPAPVSLCPSSTGEPRNKLSTLDVSQQGWSEGKDHLSWVTGDTLPDIAQVAFGLLCCENDLLAWCSTGLPGLFSVGWCSVCCHPVRTNAWAYSSAVTGLCVS